jgi:acyl-CoA reductase-like NAD-dependent aldehyde dehydrogenase
MYDIHDQVTRTVAQWARLVTWGQIIDEAHTLYAPTILADVAPGMTSWEEEVFWPVASICKVKTIEEAIALANQNEFWLSAVVYGDNIQECKQVAAQLEWGMIFINQAAWSKSSLPFWGVKKSGYGKENGPDGLKSFTNRKVVLY